MFGGILFGKTQFAEADKGYANIIEWKEMCRTPNAFEPILSLSEVLTQGVGEHMIGTMVFGLAPFGIWGDSRGENLWTDMAEAKGVWKTKEADIAQVSHCSTNK